MESLKKYPWLLLLVLLLACAGEEDEEGGILNPDVDFAAEVNGKKFEALVEEENVDAYFSLEGEYYSFFIEAYDYKDVTLGRAQVIAIGFTAENLDELKPGDEFPNHNFIFGPLTHALYIDYKTFGDATGGGVISTTEDNFDDIRIRITDLNQGSQRISGEFSFIIYDGDNDKNYQANGRFSNIPYTIKD